MFYIAICNNRIFKISNGDYTYIKAGFKPAKTTHNKEEWFAL
jgi:hypothetical protein